MPSFVFLDRDGRCFARAKPDFLTPLHYNYLVETAEEPAAPGFTVHFKLFSWPVRIVVTRDLAEWITVTAEECGNRFHIHEEGRDIAEFERKWMSLTDEHRITLFDRRYERFVFILVALRLYRKLDKRRRSGDE